MAEHADNEQPEHGRHELPADAAVPARSVLPTMALLDAARESSRTGQAVDVRGRVEWVY